MLHSEATPGRESLYIHMVFSQAFRNWPEWRNGDFIPKRNLKTLLIAAHEAKERYWVRYAITSRRVVITNMFTGQEIQSMALEGIGEITVQQGLIARFLGIGTIVLRSARGDQASVLRGIQEPETTQSHLQAVRLGGRFLRPEEAG